MKTKKIDKEFCFTDESVNVYGYRCLTSGLQLDEVKKNPIGYFMHQRDNGVVVRWEDFRIEGSKVWAKPVINLSHPEGQRIVDQIENGFLNGASAGKIVCLEASDNKDLKLPNQKGPTITKWFPREISLVDIPGNYNALANLFDQNNQVLNLSDLVKNQPVHAVGISIDENLLKSLGLTSTATQNDFNNAIQVLINKSIELENLKKAGTTNTVEAMLDKAIAENKITPAMASELMRSYANNPLALKELIDAIPSLNVPADLQNKTWDELYVSGKLEVIRTKYPVLYEQLKAKKYPQLKD